MPPVSRRQQPDQLDKIARRQSGVVSRRQLAECGFDNDAVARRVGSGQWQPAGLAIVLHNGPLTTLQHHWSAVLTAPGIAAVGGRAACASYGLKGFPYLKADVLVAATAKPVPMLGVEWRRSRRFSSSDISSSRRLPMTPLDRAVIDAAAWTDPPKVACALAVASVQQRLTNPQKLRKALADAGQVRHAGVLRFVLADIEGGADSLAEIDLAKLARRAGLPPPIRQMIRYDRSGRRRFLDADFGTFSVEIDGGFHLKPLNYWDDARRHNDLVLVGQRILRFPSVALRLEPEVVVAQLRAAKSMFG
jgi:hypothetical protein